MAKMFVSAKFVSGKQQPCAHTYTDLSNKGHQEKFSVTRWSLRGLTIRFGPEPVTVLFLGTPPQITEYHAFRGPARILTLDLAKNGGDYAGFTRAA